MVACHFTCFKRRTCGPGPELCAIHGLEKCPNLERLWMNENDLTGISGLSKCVKLKELYLYSNAIARIEGLETLANLEVLRRATPLWQGQIFKDPPSNFDRGPNLRKGGRKGRKG